MIDFNLAPRQPKTIHTEKNPYLSFAEAMLGYGLKAGELIADGKLHRFDINKTNDKCGWFSRTCEYSIVFYWLCLIIRN